MQNISSHSGGDASVRAAWIGPAADASAWAMVIARGRGRVRHAAASRLWHRPHSAIPRTEPRASHRRVSTGHRSRRGTALSARQSTGAGADTGNDHSARHRPMPACLRRLTGWT